MTKKDTIVLSSEQNDFIAHALNGENILVNACIGSGKTTVIQKLYKRLRNQDKLVLYLTYNRLLKEEARNRIDEKMKSVVNNYHGFAWYILNRVGIAGDYSYENYIQGYLEHKDALDIPKYDVLIIDEYQDIDQEISEMLEHIKSVNKDIQIIAVGDMDQKIYDKTRLNVDIFIKELLGNYIEIKFTKCFRICESLASRFGNIWNKEIVGVNESCIVEEKRLYEVIDFLATQKTKDVLCLGMRGGSISDVLNKLEERYPTKYNKNTTYASIRNNDSNTLNVKQNAAIFTTYDGSKGLERNICVIFDWTRDYWNLRLNKEDARWEIIRNIFCVAASRGKKRIIFVKYDDKEKLLDNDLIIDTKLNNSNKIYNVSTMFDFKYMEDIIALYNMLKVSKLKQDDTSVIDIKSNDGYIDLSPCIGIIQEASYFNKYDIDEEIEYYKFLYNANKKQYKLEDNESIDRKVLYMTALETNQDRYRNQVNIPYITKSRLNCIHTRLGEILSKDEDVQIECGYQYINGSTTIDINGRADVIKNNIVYELKFVSNLSYVHYLQCACYITMFNLEEGMLWNIKDNTLYKISVPDKDKFIKEVLKTITKGEVEIN